MIRALAAGLAAAALACAAASPARAWGEFGHHTTAGIAMNNVSPATARAIRALLRAEAGLGTPYCPVRTLADASAWPDCIRQEGWRWSHTFAWHYQTQNICRAYDVKANCAGGNCVTAQIERNRRLLADRQLPAAQRLEAMAWLAHLVGDLHMPLHSGDNADLGGNQVRARYGIAPGRNLHAVWDGPMAERGVTSAVPSLIRRYTAEERAAMGAGSVADWGRESWEAARGEIYARAFGRDPCGGAPPPAEVVWSNEAIDAALPLLRRRVSEAGLRLARLLDEALR